MFNHVGRKTLNFNRWNAFNLTLMHSEILGIVKVLKFWTLVACQKGWYKHRVSAGLKFTLLNPWNRADPDQTASEEAVWSGSSLFAILTSILWI